MFEGNGANVISVHKTRGLPFQFAGRKGRLILTVDSENNMVRGRSHIEYYLVPTDYVEPIKKKDHLTDEVLKGFIELSASEFNILTRFASPLEVWGANVRATISSNPVVLGKILEDPSLAHTHAARIASEKLNKPPLFPF